MEGIKELYMYQKIKDVTLKTGDKAELGVLTGPDSSTNALELRALLGHKGLHWKWQIEQSLDECHQNVESRFYMLSKGGLPFANIMSIESRRVGIFGHVYTVPEERRKGAADLLQEYQLQDFKKRGGQALYLGTDFNSAPFRLYERHGFKGSEPECGCMFWFARTQDEFEREAFAHSPVSHQPLSYEYWATLPALSMIKHPSRARIVGMHVTGAITSEGGSLSYMIAMEKKSGIKLDERHRGANAWVAVSDKSGLPVAIAAAAPEHYFFEQTTLLDVFAAPGFESELPALYKRLNIPSGRSVIAYADTHWRAKFDALSACGLKKSSTLTNHLRSAGRLHDIELWSK